MQPDVAHRHVDGPAPDAQKLRPQGQCAQKAILAMSTRGSVAVFLTKSLLGLGILLSQEGSTKPQLGIRILCVMEFLCLSFFLQVEIRVSPKFY